MEAENHPEPLFQPQSVTSLRERTYETLRDAILTGRLQPGLRLKERELAVQMGISTTPVKQALHMLLQDGLVVSLPRRGVAVSNLSTVPISEVTTIRAALEGAACRLAAEKATDPELNALNLHVKRMAFLTETGSVDELSRANSEFHEMLRAIAHNPYLEKMWEVVRAHTRHWRRKALTTPQEPQRGLQEHQAILQALLDRDGEAAEQRMRAHILRTLKHVLGQAPNI